MYRRQACTNNMYNQNDALKMEEIRHHSDSRARRQKEASANTSTTSGVVEEAMTESTTTGTVREPQDRTRDTHSAEDTDIKYPAFDAFEETKRPKKKSAHIEQKFAKLCRLLIYLLTFGLVVTCGVVNKLSVLKIVNDYNQSSGDDKLTNAVYLLVLICIYPSLTLLSSVFKVLFGHTQRLSVAVIVLVVVVGFLNTIGMMLLIFTVLSQLTFISSLLIMAFLPIVPITLCLFRHICQLFRGKGKTYIRCLKLTGYVVAFVIQAGCLFWLYYTNILDISMNSPIAYIAPLAIVLISLGWWENFTNLNLPCKSKHSNISDNNNNSHIVSLRLELKRGRDKAAMFSSLSKLVTVGACVLLVHYNKIPDSIGAPLFYENSSLQSAPSQIAGSNTEQQNNTAAVNLTEIARVNSICTQGVQNSSGVHNVTELCKGITGRQTSDVEDHSGNSESFIELIYDYIIRHYIVLLSIGLTFVVSYCATLACKLQMQRFSFSLATLLISPLTFLYVCLRCSQLLPTEMLIFETTNMCPAWNVVPTEGIALFAAVWFSTILLTYYIWMPKAERMAKIDSMFVSPLKDCILLDYNLLLRRKNDHKETTGESSNRNQSSRPKLYVCATMWHETRKEMFQLLKSLLRLDEHCAVSHLTEKKFGANDKDAFDPEVHVIIDNAFDDIDPVTKEERPNKYVLQFLDCLEEAATAILGSERKSEWTDVPVLSVMPYGARINRVLPGGTTMVIHLKNKNKIRHRKRWSQVMYLYYLLGFKFFEYKEKTKVFKNNDKTKEDDRKLSFVNRLSDKDKLKLENTFILTLDGDVDFKPSSVIRLLDRMKKNVQVGAVCGRIHPIGSGPLVWYQKFEYAVGHWLQKAAEHVLGCVLCCPGCFSLFRASALVDNNVMRTYTRKPKEALDYIQFEQGEDRWLCTLLLQQGYKIDYCAGADAKTFAPESFNDFYIQRRRWSPSTNANILDLIMSWRHTVSQNADISRLFIAYQALMIATSILAPATVTMLIAGSYSAVLGINDWYAYLLAMGPIIYYIFVCMKLPDSVQLASAAVLSAVYTVVMIVVTVGTILNIVSEDILSPTVMFLACLSAIFVLAGLWHPREIGCLFHGILYYVAVPSTFIFLTVYFICNIHVVKWGTRENTTASKSKTKQKASKSDLIYQVLNAAKTKLVGDTTEQCEEVTEAVDEEAPAATTKDNANPSNVIKDWTCLEPYSQYTYDDITPKSEERFWQSTLKKYLEPVQEDSEHAEKMKTDLMDLRNNIVFAFFMLNFLFSVALLQLQMNREKLTSFYLFGKYEPVSIIFLSIFTFLLVLQFVSMLVHRWSTFQHLISSTSLISCSSELSETEKFRINYRVTKKSVDDFGPPPDYDIEEEFNSADNANTNRGNDTFRRDNGETRRNSRPYYKRQNVYETRANINMSRVVDETRAYYNKRSMLTLYGKSRRMYQRQLSDHYHDYNNPI